MTSASATPPKVLLFDIGGVCVVSPFQAILDYEVANRIAPGYINHTISRTAPNGAWQRLERGEIPLDDAFFDQWASELNDCKAWEWYHLKINKPLAPIPKIKAKELFFNMMRNSRRPDPHMWPAVRKLRDSGRFVIAALSNTTKYPPECRDEKGDLFDARLIYDAGDPYVRGATGADMEKKRDVRSMFDVFISSAHVGFRKPEPPIYHLALKEVEEWAVANGKAWWREGDKMKASDAVFVDDIGQNLKTAKQLGMRTLKVSLGRNADAVRELEKVTGVTLLDDGDGDCRAKL